MKQAHRIREFCDTLAAVRELRATEAATGVTLVEAVAADAFETELRTITDTPQERDDARRMILDLVKSGVRSEEIPGMIRNYHMGSMRTLNELGLLRRQLDRSIARIQQPEGIDQ